MRIKLECMLRINRGWLGSLARTTYVENQRGLTLEFGESYVQYQQGLT
jgi:hypothetical protein